MSANFKLFDFFFYVKELKSYSLPREYDMHNMPTVLVGILL